MDKCLDAYDLLILNQEHINSLHRCIPSNVTELVIKSLSNKQCLGPDKFTAELY
jgi:hypothetical protein